MSKVTSKLQVTLPKAIADRYGVAPGGDLLFEPAGDSIRVLVAREPGLSPTHGLSIDDRQALLDAATRRQAARNRRYRLGLSAGRRKGSRADQSVGEGRGWTRAEAFTDRSAWSTRSRNRLRADHAASRPKGLRGPPLRVSIPCGANPSARR